jgi:hypothetical protein
LVRFDVKELEKPESSGIEYQKGKWEGDEVGADRIKKWERKCGDCGGENIKS